MTPTMFACPQCQAKLRLGAGVAPGSKFKCGQCGTILTTPPAPAPAAQAVQPRRPVVPPPPVPKPAASAAIKASARPAARRETPAVVRRERPAPRPEPKGFSGIAVAAICFGAVLLVGGG